MDLSSQEIGESSTMVDSEEKHSFLNKKDMAILMESSGGENCCIFRIPHTVKQNNDTTYAPKFLSIGPYHHGTDKQHLQPRKQLYLEYFVSKTQEMGVGLSVLVNVVGGLEEKIRGSYSETLEFDKQELTDLMVRDGCFILMLFLVVSKEIKYPTSEDQIFNMPWILPTIRRDLLLLENQVPLFLLEDLLKTSKLAPSTSLNMLAFEFFNYSIKKPKEFWEKHNDLEAYHLLDLIRRTFIPPSPWTFDWRNLRPKKTKMITCLDKIWCSKKRTEAQTSWSSPPRSPPPPFLRQFVSAKRLQTRGIKFQLRENGDTPLDICFKNGLLEIPQLIFDEFICSLISNSVAFEQFRKHYFSTEMTSYVTFMSCLTNGEEDALFLCEKGIIENYFESTEEVSLFFRNVAKDLTFSFSQSYLSNVFEGVKKHKKHKIPWKTLSYAGSILLLFTVAQTFFAALAYFHPLKN